MPQDRASRVGRGVARLWLGDAPGAIDDLSVSIDASPPTPDQITAWAYRARGLAHASLGQADGAVADYKAYLSVSPAAKDRAQIEAWIASRKGEGEGEGEGGKRRKVFVPAPSPPSRADRGLFVGRPFATSMEDPHACRRGQ